MENLMTNVSAWGITFVVLTTLRITWPLKLTGNTSEVLSRLTLFIQQAYKPLTVFALASVALWVCHDTMPARPVNVWIIALLAGLASVAACLALRHRIARELHKVDVASLSPGQPDITAINNLGKAATTLFDQKSTANAGMLLLGMISFFAVIYLFHSAIVWDLYTVLSCLSSFAVGGAGMLVCAKMNTLNEYSTGNSLYHVFSSYTDEVISRDRFDALVGALAAALLLGTTYTGLHSFKSLPIVSGPVLLPLALAISGVSISVMAATFRRINGWPADSIKVLAEKMLVTLVMIAVAFALVHWLLPVTWVSEGAEHTAGEVFYAAEVGIISGLLASKVVRLYRAFHHKYTAYLENKSFETTWLDNAFHGTVQAISFIMPLVLIVLAIIFSYQLVGLYGILIALVAMLSNLTTKLTTEATPH
jgi:K(+)-stimulated pyrophosphate-energized sodium pump